MAAGHFIVCAKITRHPLLFLIYQLLIIRFTFILYNTAFAKSDANEWYKTTVSNLINEDGSVGIELFDA
jgi:hypothetical protein